MERVRKKSNERPTLESVLYSTPEQKLLKFLLTQPTTAFTPRVLSSKLKGVRGLGGPDGINRILKKLEAVGLVNFVDHNRAVSIQNDRSSVQMLKVFASMCDLEGLKALLEPISSKGVMFGTHSNGNSCSDSEVDLLVETDQADEVEKIVSGFPGARKIRLTCLTGDEFHTLEKKDKKLAQRVQDGVVLWGSSW